MLCGVHHIANLASELRYADKTSGYSDLAYRPLPCCGAPHQAAPGFVGLCGSYNSPRARINYCGRNRTQVRDSHLIASPRRAERPHSTWPRILGDGSKEAPAAGLRLNRMFLVMSRDHIVSSTMICTTSRHLCSLGTLVPHIKRLAQRPERHREPSSRTSHSHSLGVTPTGRVPQ